MVSKNQIKLITSLRQKKFRLANGLFLAEGVKVISELLNSHFELEHLYQTEPVFNNVAGDKITDVTENELKKISALTTFNNCLALFKVPAPKKISNKGLIAVLDDIRDPGNLGTIIRLCDWFGISQIVCSHETADVFNPKTIQASMGSIARVNVDYTELPKYIMDSQLPVYGTFMEGNDIYSTQLQKEGIIVFGNEANGISSKVERLIKNQISIPRFGELQKAESLNVATAAAIVFSEFRRREL